MGNLKQQLDFKEIIKMSEYFIISYSYPPSSAPGAHRPYQLAKVIEKDARITIFSKEGISNRSEPLCTNNSNTQITINNISVTSKRRIKWLFNLFEPIAAFDKATFWGVKTFPFVLFSCLKFMLNKKKKPILWATAPATTNIYLALFVSYITSCKLHIDIRDAPVGVGDGKEIPFLTKLAIKRARTITTVTPSLREMLKKDLLTNKEIHVILNGTASDVIEITSSKNSHFRNRNNIVMTYAGALYGGERPINVLFESIKLSSKLTKSKIRLQIISREEFSSEMFIDNSKLEVENHKSLPKQKALARSANSHINIILIGNSPKHACAIPLKVFDLLGIGRPILIIAPESSDAVKLIKTTDISCFHLISDKGKIKKYYYEKLATWIEDSSRLPTNKIQQYMACNEIKKMIGIIEEKGFIC